MTYAADSLWTSAARGTIAGWINALANRGADKPAEIATTYFALAPRFGLNADLALAQACQETGWFTSAHWRQERNPAGLGITGDGVQGVNYDTITNGVTAHYEHLCCYVYTLSECPCDHAHLQDTRHWFHDGVPTLSTLERPPFRQWAYPGTNYVAAILAIANAVIPQVVPPGGTLDIDSIGIIDLRPQIRAAHPDVPGQGAGYTSAKSGVIIHYNGPPTSDPALARFISDAGFHQGPYLREKTIAYIYGIGDEPGDGTDAPIYLMRDPDDVCWHCGSWPENATYTPIAFTFGEGQSAGPGQLRAVTKLVDALRARDGFGRENVKGHKEVDSTACPGTLMDDFVYPYRAGSGIVSDYVTFAQTGHGIGGGFRAFFEHHGGVPIFGLPVTEEVQEKCADGVTRTVQYFERNVMEYHPENQSPNDVQLRRLGAKEAKEAGFSGPGIG